MANKFEGNEGRQITNDAELIDQAYLALAKSNAPNIIRSVTYDLSEARTEDIPEIFKIPFKSIFISEATDSAVRINFFPFNIQAGSSSLPLSKNGSLSFEKPIADALFTWEAQPNKSITLIFILNGEYQPGSLFTEVSSSVDGNAITASLVSTITGVASLLIPQDLTRTSLSINSSSPMEIGGNIAGPFFAIPASYTIKNTAAFYARRVGGTGPAIAVELLVQN